MKSSSLPHKDAMILLMCEFSGDKLDEEQGTEQWTNAIDRGGLWHVNDNTYFIFYLMEEEIRKHLVISSVKTLDSDTKKKVLDAVLSAMTIYFSNGVCLRQVLVMTRGT